MATPNTQLQSVLRPETARENIAEVIAFPHQYDGDFASQLDIGALPFTMHVDDWEELSQRYDRGVGLTETSLVTVADSLGRFNDLSRFVVRTITPENPKYTTPVEIVPPLGTRVKGYNTYLARQLAKAGMPVRIVGTNQTHGHSLLHDAQADLVIRNADDRRGSVTSANFAPDTSMYLVYSMGIMKTLGITQLAPFFGREIALTKGIDPCGARERTYGEMATKAMGGYLLREVAEIPRNTIADVRETGFIPTARRSRHWLGTISLHPAFFSNTRDKWETIMTGEAGTFAPGMPEDTTMVVHSFNQSLVNDGDVYEDQLKDFPNVRFVRESGYHLSAVSTNTTKNMVQDMTEAMELYESGASKDEILAAASRPILARR